MPTFPLVFWLSLLGICSIVTSPVPTGKGKRVFLFFLGVALWAVAYSVVRTNEEVLMDLLSSDYALSGALANQAMASLVIYGAGWYIFVSTSAKSEVRRAMLSAYERLGNDEPEEREVRVFRPWPGILVWIPTVLVLVAIWFVPVHFAGVDLEPTANPTLTSTPTLTETVAATKTPTSTPTATQASTATPTSTSIATATPEPTAKVAPTQTPDPNKPALVCNGTWLHQEPVQLGGFKILFELCDGGRYFVTHEIGSDWGLIQLEYTEFATPEGRFRFELKHGEILVNGVPFSQWLASKGGK